jgi:hypothetical protein
VLPEGQREAVPVPFNVCEEETITVVVGWDTREAQLLVDVTTPLGATITAGSPGVEASSSHTWTFLRVPLPHGGERDGTWKVTVFRPRIGSVEFPDPTPEVRYFINVVASGGAVLRRMPDNAKYYTGDVINPLVGLQYLQGGLPPNAKLQVTVSRPDASVGNLLSQEKLGAAVVIDADTIPTRQATLMAIERRNERPAVGYTQQTFDLFDDIIHTNSPEPAGIFGNPLKICSRWKATTPSTSGPAMVIRAQRRVSCSGHCTWTPASIPRAPASPLTSTEVREPSPLSRATSMATMLDQAGEMGYRSRAYPAPWSASRPVITVTALTQCL